MKSYYRHPKQCLVIYDTDENTAMGIAFKDSFIFAEDGSVLPLANVEIVHEYSWVNFEEEISE